LVDELYSSVVTAGTYRAPSIKVAEAAKVIENTQRDLNIALINELSRIFDLLDIDTHEVLAAASTKWNFLPFQPGLVGGHCIGVDPYYLTHRAEQIGYTPKVILAGRAINDSMGSHVADRVLALVKERSAGENTKPRVLILGATFKENCPDTRNSRVVDVIWALTQQSCDVVIVDPWVSRDDQVDIDGASWMDFHDLLGIDVVKPVGVFDAVVVTVPHREFLETGERLRSVLTPKGILFDVKGLLPRHTVDGRL
jgi:UDP-N-acetyl-D-galactosamine dehydrogenase